jgi:hypothetical protein
MNNQLQYNSGPADFQYYGDNLSEMIESEFERDEAVEAMNKAFPLES